MAPPKRASQLLTQRREPREAQPMTSGHEESGESLLRKAIDGADDATHKTMAIVQINDVSSTKVMIDTPTTQVVTNCDASVTANHCSGTSDAPDGNANCGSASDAGGASSSGRWREVAARSLAPGGGAAMNASNSAAGRGRASDTLSRNAEGESSSGARDVSSGNTSRHGAIDV